MHSSSLENSRLTEELIEKALLIAKKKFTPGDEEHTKYKNLHGSLKDPNFIRKGNWIADTNFAATLGPRRKSMEEFIDDSIHNPARSIHDIVAMCFLTTSTKHFYKDFFDYSLETREETYGKYHVSIERINGDIKKKGPHIRPVNVVQSRLTITYNKDDELKTELINVTTFRLSDMYPFYLNDQTSDEIKDQLFKLYLLSLEKPILVHCKAGRGRTGHFILMMEILRHYDTIFRDSNPEIIADKLIDQLNQIRKSRPALVSNQRQFVEAVRNAVALHQFGLEKNYIKETMPSVRTLHSQPTRKFFQNLFSCFNRKKTRSEGKAGLRPHI